VSPEEQAAIVAVFEARWDDEGWHEAAALATAWAHRIDQRIKEVDGLATYLERTRRKAA
jgi:hypothetical protein